MSNRRRTGVTNRTIAYSAAALIHIGLLAALLFNYSAKEHIKVEAHEAKKVDTINASLINEKDISDQQAKMRKLEKERERKKREAEQRERDRLAQIKQQADEQQKKVDDLKKQQAIEKQKAIKLEQERKAIALKKKKAEDERKKKAAAEKKRLAALEKKRIAKKKEADRLKRKKEDLLERQRLNALLAEEEAEQKRRAAERIAKERTATIQSQYSARIQAAVKRFYRVAPGTDASLKAVVSIKVSPFGDVLSVRLLQSSGSPEFDQSLQAAISQASPLPIPTPQEDQTAHDNFVKEIKTTFRPYD